MDPAEEHFSHGEFHNILLSPIPERSEIDITGAMANPSGSIFDPPEEENEAYSEQNEQPVRSPDPTSLSSLSSNIEPERMLTRSKSGATSKRASLLPEEGGGSKTVLTKKKRTKSSTKKVSKETQVVPRMLPPARKRASKKQTPKDPEIKENVPPSPPKRQRPSTSSAHEDPEFVDPVPPRAPKKQHQFREGHDMTGIRRRVHASSPLDTSSDVDNIAPSISSVQDSPQHLSSSQYQADQGSLYEFPSITEDEDINFEYQMGMDSRKSVVRALEPPSDNQHGEEVDGRKNDLRSLAENGEGSSSTPLSGITIKIPQSDPNKQPMALLLHPEMFREGNSVGIKVSDGEVFVSSKHDREETPNKNKKRNQERRSRGRRHGRRSHKTSWTSTESDYSTGSSCSCSSCDSYCSCSDCSTSSSSDCDHHHRHRY